VLTFLVTRHPTQTPTRSPIYDQDVFDDNDGGSSSNGADQASIGFIIGAIIAAISVLYCVSLHRKFFLCQTRNERDDEDDEEAAERRRNIQRGNSRNQTDSVQGREGAIQSQKFSQVKFAKGPETDIDATCAICICDMEDEDDVKQLPSCKHCYHSDCLDEWLRRSKLCPLCKSDVTLQLTGSMVGGKRSSQQQARPNSASSNIELTAHPTRNRSPMDNILGREVSL
jgi:hypothetical protein